MLILKGLLFGVALSLIYSVAYLLHMMGPFDTNKATGLSALRAWTIQNPYYWAAFVGILFTACVTVILWQKIPIPPEDIPRQMGGKF